MVADPQFSSIGLVLLAELANLSGLLSECTSNSRLPERKGALALVATTMDPDLGEAVVRRPSQVKANQEEATQDLKSSTTRSRNRVEKLTNNTKWRSIGHRRRNDSSKNIIDSIFDTVS